MKKKKTGKLILLICGLVVIAIVVFNSASCLLNKYSNHKYEKNLLSALTVNALNDNDDYYGAQNYDNAIFSPYLKENMESSVVYVVDENTIIQYGISIGTAEGIIYKKIHSDAIDNDYIIKMYFIGIAPTGISADCYSPYFSVWVSLEDNCEPSTGFFHYVNAENYDRFYSRFGDEIITDLHEIYVSHTKKMLDAVVG